MPFLTFLAYAMLACCVLLVLIGWLLWSHKRDNQHANRLLATLLFAYAYIYFVTVLITDGGIRSVPHLFRTAAPLNYLIGPLIYLYVRASLTAATRPNYRLYGWLFLPALLNVIELIPFYIQSAAYKLNRLQTLSSSSDSLYTINEGLLPPQFHLIGYSISSLVYSLLAGRLWWRYRHEEQNRHTNPVYANWLQTFVGVHILANIIWVIELPFVRNNSFGNLTLNVTFTVAQLIICLYIIRRPALLYGAYSQHLTRAIPPALRSQNNPVPLPGIQPESSTSMAKNITPPEPDELERDVQEKLIRLETYMRTKQPYLQPRLSLADVSVATQVPPYLLSTILNRVCGLEFRDYVNEHRVRHICQLLESSQFAHLTLEGVSSQAGFSSKTTFYRAFRKHTGATPAQYVARRNRASQP